MLEENEKLARARLAAVEVFQCQIADEAKGLKSAKQQVSKKVYYHHRNTYFSVNESAKNGNSARSLDTLEFFNAVTGYLRLFIWNRC